MLRLTTIAVTGGPSTGKTSVCRFFKEFGAYVVDTDDIVHFLLETSLKGRVVELLGDEILSHGQIDRARVAKKVFSNKDLLKALEAIIHPVVKHEIQKSYTQAAEQPKYPLFVVEIPLLFEAGWESDFDHVALVTTPPEISMKRSALSEHDYQLRASRFLPEERKTNASHFHIDNKGSMESLKQSVKSIYQQLVNP